MIYDTLMKKCIKLATKGMGSVSPNPLVGCIVLNKDGLIISKGFHKKYGLNHAERNALINLNNDETRDGTLIVTLEPCSHFGKTPPCADLIIEKEIKKVVIGMRDVNPIVSGKGIKKLKDAGIEIIEGIMEKECKELNEVFIKNMTEHKTFVAIKTATTLDGKIATSTGSSKWITSEKARKEVKNIRKRYDAILTTASTIIADNPQMEHKNKIILDRNLRTDFVNAQIYKNGICYVFYDKKIASEHLDNTLTAISKMKNVKLYPIKTKFDKIDLDDLLSKIYDLGIMSVLVETGGHLNGSILKYADKIYHFIAPKILGDNSGLSCFDFQKISDIAKASEFEYCDIKTFKPDILLTYKRK